MHRYDRAIMQDWHPGWLFAPTCVWLILFSMALSVPVQHYEPGVRYALPDPCAMYCLPAGHGELSSFAEIAGQG